MLAPSVILAVCFKKPMITCVAGRTESKTSPEWITRSTSRSKIASTALPYASWTSTSRWLRLVFGQSFAYREYPRCVSEMCAIRTMVSEILAVLDRVHLMKYCILALTHYLYTTWNRSHTSGMSVSGSLPMLGNVREK